MERIKVSISTDKRTAWVNIRDGGSSLKEVLVALREAGVVHGIMGKVLDDLFATKDFGRNIAVARSTPMERGQDARIEYLISEEKGIGKDLENGRIDFRSIDFVKSVEPGIPLLRKIPGTDGVPEIGVTGEVLQADPGKDFDLHTFIGEGTALSEEDTNLVVATKEGIYHRGRLGRMSVEDSVVIRGDIDFEVGNIDTPSAIIIGGDVRGGFEISSGRHITIKGVVEDAQVMAEGNLTVQGGITKGNRGIEAGGGISTKYIYDRAHVAANSVRVAERIGHSNFRITGEVRAYEIVGGRLIVGRRVEVNNLGSPNYALTEIEVGTDLDVQKNPMQLKDEMKVKKQKIRAMEQKKNAAEKKASSLSEKLRKIVIQNRELFRSEVVMKIGAEAKKYVAEVKEYEGQLAHLKEEIKSLQKEIEENDPVVIVRETVFPGATITLGMAEPFRITQTFMDVHFRLDDNGKVEVVPNR